MKISGLQKLTLLDYAGKMAAIVFIDGCNFRCPFCHNSSLVLGNNDPSISEEELFSFLNKRKNILDGIVISGGEPLLYEETLDLMAKIKSLSYHVKLDTNGSFPMRLKEAVKRGVVDYVAMDIKNSKEKYNKTIDKDNFDIAAIEESVDFLKENHVPYEFRTTVTNELHTPSDFEKIGGWVKGCPLYFLQPYRDSENVIRRGLTSPPDTILKLMKSALEPFVGDVQIRGIE